MFMPFSLAILTSSKLHAELMWAVCMRPPVCLASSKSRLIIISSCSRGMPFMPSFILICPSFICPQRQSEQSWLWLIIKLPWCALYSSAALITSELTTGSPSSLNAMQPASSILPISTRRSPLLPCVIALIGYRSIRPQSLAFWIMYFAISGLSFTGFVFAMQQAVVTPPAAAARLPVMISSLYSWPGSRKCTCISISPGITSLPLASITRSASLIAELICVILLFLIRIFAFCVSFAFIMVAFFIKILIFSPF